MFLPRHDFSTIYFETNKPLLFVKTFDNSMEKIVLKNDFNIDDKFLLKNCADYP